MAQLQGKPILELSTLAPDRPLITIDGASFEIAVQTDFGILDSHGLRRLQAPITEYYAADDPSETQTLAMVKALREFCVLVIRGAGQELVDKLTERQQLQVAEVFTNAAGLTVPEQPTPVRRRARRPTSEK